MIGFACFAYILSFVVAAAAIVAIISSMRVIHVGIVSGITGGCVAVGLGFALGLSFSAFREQNHETYGCCQSQTNNNNSNHGDAISVSRMQHADDDGVF